MDPAQVITAVLGAGGGGMVLLALVNGLIKWFTGAPARERSRNRDLLSQKNDALEAQEKAEREKRLAYEYASQLRRVLFENGITPPDWPLTVTEAHKLIKGEN